MAPLLLFRSHAPWDVCEAYKPKEAAFYGRLKEATENAAKEENRK